jgi:hypothetical protein
LRQLDCGDVDVNSKCQTSGKLLRNFGQYHTRAATHFQHAGIEWEGKFRQQVLADGMGPFRLLLVALMQQIQVWHMLGTLSFGKDQDVG